MAQLSTTGLLAHPSLRAYWKLEDLTDSASSNTLTNNNSVTFAAAKYSNGADFGSSNTNKSLTIASELSTQGNSDVSIHCWVQLKTEIGSGTYVFFEHSATTGSDRYLNLSYEYNAGTRRLVLDAGATKVTVNTTMGTSSWYHLAGTRNNSGNATAFYINGILVGTSTVGATGKTQQKVSVGADTAGASFSSAIVDDAALYQTILSASEIAEIYNEVAGSSNTNSLRYNSASSQKVTVTNPTALNSLAAMTVEFWLRPTTISNSQGFVSRSNGGASHNSWTINTDGGGTSAIQMSIESASTAFFGHFATAPSSTLVVGLWQHYAWVFDGSQTGNAARLVLYVNGVAQTLTFSGTIPAALTSVTQDLSLGYRGDSTNYLNGYMNEVRVWNTARTQALIRTNMTAQLIGSETGLIEYWRCNQSSGTTLTATTGTSGTLTGWTAGKEGWTVDVPYSASATKNNYAMALSNSSSQAFTIIDASSLKPTGSFTIEAWIKTTDTSDQVIFQSKSENTAIAGINLYVDASGKLAGRLGKNTGTTVNTDWKVIGGTSSLRDGIWHHAAYTYDGTTMKLYVDGVEEGTATPGFNAVYAGTNYVRIGAWNDTGANFSFFSGYIDEVRLWSVARSASELLGSKQIDVTGTANLVSVWKAENNGVDLVGFNNATPVNSPVFLSSTPFALYPGGSKPLFFNQL